ncbi:MAG: CIA30 family protein [Fibrobacter sp.]|nr:CIA30 family protein [Fibrobacter sp.]
MTKKKLLTIPLACALALCFFACEGDNTVSVSEKPAPGPEAPDDSSADSTQNSTEVKLLVDDFEDGDNQSPLGDYWYVYNDAGSGAESTIETVTKDSEGHPAPTKSDNGSKYSFNLKYTLKKGNYEWDAYVGWGVGLPKNDYSKYNAVQYRYKGGSHNVHIEISDITDSDHYSKTVPASNEWTTVTVKFTDMKQEDWGVPVPFNAAHINKVSFQAKGPDTQDSVFIDDIYLICDGSGIDNGGSDNNEPPKAEEKVPDIVPKDAVIPKVTLGELNIDTDLQKKAMKYLNKGVSFTNWLEENRKFNGTFKVGKDDIKILSDNGFKAIRLPIDLDKYTLNRDEFVKDATGKTELKIDSDTLFNVLDSFVEWTREYNMSLTIDYHEYDNSYNATSASNKRYQVMMAEVWKAVAAHYASNEREDIFYELLNEPDMSNGKVTAAQWTEAAQGIIDSIRTVDKKHTLLFGDVEWYSITKLAGRTPFADTNIVYVIHSYEPFVFTHQGASWSETKDLKNIPFPYDKAKWPEYSSELGLSSTTPSWVKSNVLNYYKTGNKETMLNTIYTAKAWAVKNKVPVIINEFGAYNLRSTAQDRLNYLTAMREICDTLQIPWTHWGYTGGFEVIKGGKLVEGLDKAMGLTKPTP